MAADAENEKFSKNLKHFVKPSGGKKERVPFDK
jgi:hypothetical protein